MSEYYSRALAYLSEGWADIQYAWFGQTQASYYNTGSNELEEIVLGEKRDNSYSGI